MNSESKILALKYRPQTFKIIMGQQVVSQSIFNSIKNNKIPNAYMFLEFEDLENPVLQE